MDIKQFLIDKLYIIVGAVILLALLALPIYGAQTINKTTGVTNQQIMYLFMFIVISSVAGTTTTPMMEALGSSMEFTYILMLVLVFIGAILIIVAGVINIFVQKKVINVALPAAGISIALIGLLFTGTGFCALLGGPPFMPMFLSDTGTSILFITYGLGYWLAIGATSLAACKLMFTKHEE